MLFRNPVEYLHNPPPREVSANAFFRHALEGVEAWTHEHSSIVIWLKDGKWFASAAMPPPHKDLVAPQHLAGDASAPSDTVTEAVLDIYDPSGTRPPLLLTPEDEKEVSDLLRLIFVSMYNKPGEHRDSPELSLCKVGIQYRPYTGFVATLYDKLAKTGVLSKRAPVSHAIYQVSGESVQEALLDLASLVF